MFTHMRNYWCQITNVLITHEAIDGEIALGSKGSVQHNPDNKVNGTNMGPIWGRQDPGGPHVGPMNFAIWEDYISWYGIPNTKIRQ